MAGAALRGFGKALLKKTRPKYLKKIPRGTPTKAGLVARRAELRGETIAQKYKKALGPAPKAVRAKAIKKSGAIDFTSGAGAGLLAGYVLGKGKTKKEAKAKETKEKLKKSAKEHEKKTKEKREKYGKHHG